MRLKIKLSFFICILLCISQANAITSATPSIPKETQQIKAKTKKNKTSKIALKKNRKPGFIKSFIQKFKKTYQSFHPSDRGKGQAIVSLIFGILSIPGFVFLVFGIVGLILGKQSLKKYWDGMHEKKGIAKAGVILSIVGLCISLVYWSLFLITVIIFGF